jgi:hypothetical protein
MACASPQPLSTAFVPLGASPLFGVIATYPCGPWIYGMTPRWLDFQFGRNPWRRSRLRNDAGIIGPGPIPSSGTLDLQILSNIPRLTAVNIRSRVLRGSASKGAVCGSINWRITFASVLLADPCSPWMTRIGYGPDRPNCRRHPSDQEPEIRVGQIDEWRRLTISCRPSTTTRA